MRTHIHALSGIRTYDLQFSIGPRQYAPYNSRPLGLTCVYIILFHLVIRRYLLEGINLWNSVIEK
jgi:hypothetical protein